MTVEAISGIAATALEPVMPAAEPLAPAWAVAEPAPSDGVSFDTLVDGIETLNQRLVASADAVHTIALGQVDNMHQAMMSGEQTRLAFDLMLQVRGKLLDAYQELLRMQV
jgi:flagellar hook-basal body complex protein FliE